MAAGGVMWEFLASVGFKVDEGGMKAALSKVAGFAAGIQAVVAGVYAGVVSVARAEVATANAARSLGISVDALEELDYAAQAAGMSSEELRQGLTAMAKARPGIRNIGEEIDKAARATRGMTDEQRKAWAAAHGFDPSVIPLLAKDVAGLREEYRKMASVSGVTAEQAAADSRGLVAELARLQAMGALLAKSLSLALMGKVRRTVENLRRAVTENFDKIKVVFLASINAALRIAGAIGSAAARIIQWVSAVAGWFDRFSEGQKKLIIGAGLLIAAWKKLNLAFLKTPLGMILAGLTAILALVDDFQTYMEGGDSLIDWGPYKDAILGVADAFKIAVDLIGVNLQSVMTLLSDTGALLKALFTGDLEGTIAAAKQLWADYCAAVANFFTTLWTGIKEKFPDFAALAEGAAAGIIAAFRQVPVWFRNLWDSVKNWAADAANAMVGALGRAADWLKEKLMGILPDFVKGWLSDGGSAAPSAPPHADITPSPAAQAGIAGGARETRQNVNIDQKNSFTITGAADPQATANAVAARQDGVNAAAVRNLKGAAL